MTEFNHVYADTIFPEMMAHPGLFTHWQPKKVALIGDAEQRILREILKHENVLEIYQNNNCSQEVMNNKIILDIKLNNPKPNSIDLIINANDAHAENVNYFFNLLTQDGILIQQSASPLSVNALKTLKDILHHTGFSDLQILTFPQPDYLTGWRCVFMALKQGMFKRLREKVIYNKSFKTHYYNFDMHKAATVLPEFIRDYNLF